MQSSRICATSRESEPSSCRRASFSAASVRARITSPTASGLRQIEPLVQKGPQGEFAQIRQSGPCLQDQPQDSRRRNAPAVTRQFRRVFAGVGMGRAKNCEQAVVGGLARFRVEKRPVVRGIARVPRRVAGAGRPKNLRRNRDGLPPGNADDGDSPFSGRRSDRCDCLLQVLHCAPVFVTLSS